MLTHAILLASLTASTPATGSAAALPLHPASPVGAVRLAYALHTPYSVAQALVWRLALLNDRRAETMADAATETRRYCDEQGFPAMSASATAFLGLALNDLDVILEGTGALASTGTLLMAPSACMWVADSYPAESITTVRSIPVA